MRNEDILAPLMPEIYDMRAAGMTWREISHLLAERGVVSAAGSPFTIAALRTYWSNHSRPKDAPASPQLAELEAALKSEQNLRLTAEYHRDRLATMMAEYLISRMQWTRGVLATGRRNVGPEYVNYQSRSRELREWIQAISPGAATIADRAGELVTLLCFDLAAEPNMQLSVDDLAELRITDKEDLDRHVRQQRQATGHRWELAMAAATPLWP